MQISTLFLGIPYLSALVAAAPLGVSTDFVAAVTATNTAVLAAIETQAHGSLSNIPPPAAPLKGGDDSVISFKVVAGQEAFESYYFQSFLYNVTNGVDGYVVPEPGRTTLVDALTAIVAQEELHYINANKAIIHFTNDTSEIILPCQYQFGVTDWKSALALAATFTDVVMGTLQDISVIFGTNGDAPLIRGVAATLGQEGQQSGFFRAILGKNPSELPFLTASTRELAFNALNQNFIVPGSCPTTNKLDLPTFGALTLLSTGVTADTTSLQFSFTLDDSQSDTTWGNNFETLSLVYINQQNIPISNALENVEFDGQTVRFTSAFHFDAATFGNGLTIAVLATTNSAPDVTTLTAATKFGPALIEIN